MEETESKKGDASTEFMTSTLDGVGQRINHVDGNNGLTAVHHEVSNNKHSYWRGRGAWVRSPEPPDCLNKIVDPSRTVIDTKAPFESVKDAVNMFGGNVEWKAQSALIKERSRNFEQELEKAEQEVPIYQKQLEVAEAAKATVLRELETTKKQVEELRLQLQKALTEEANAQQDSDLAQLRVKEIQQGIGNEHSVAAKAQVKVAKTRCLEADEELKSIEVQIEALKKECERLMEVRDIASKKTVEAKRASEEVERRNEELTNELIVVKEALESAQASHVKAEERRFSAAMEMEEDSHDWDQKLKQTQEEMHCFEEKLTGLNDLKTKFDAASALLTSLKLDLATHVETEKTEFAQPETLTAVKMELEEVKTSIAKTKDEVNCLRIATFSLKSKLEEETSRLSLLKQKEKTSDKLEKGQHEQDEVQIDLPHELQEKIEEAYEAKSKAREELTKAMEEAELARASANTMELGLQAVFKEIEAAKASEKLALDTVKAIQESEEGSECAQGVISIPLEDYYALSERAGGAERVSNERVAAAVVRVKDAKRTELMSRRKLEAAFKEIKERKAALREAAEKAEKATEGKMKMEQELREWRSENERRRKAGEAGEPKGVRCYWKSFDDSSDINGLNPSAISLRVNSTPNPNRHYTASEGDAQLADVRPRRRKFFFPRIVMFLARRKVRTLN